MTPEAPEAPDKAETVIQALEADAVQSSSAVTVTVWLPPVALKDIEPLSSLIGSLPISTKMSPGAQGATA